MNVSSALLLIAYVLFSAWLSWRILRLFIAPYLRAGHRSKTPIQFFITDYYALMGEIALGLAVVTDLRRSDSLVFLISILFTIVVMAAVWFAGTRILSRARVNQFGPRAVGQFLFLVQTAFALFYGFITVPLLIMSFEDAKAIPLIFGSAVVFLILYGRSNLACNWILRKADPAPPEGSINAGPSFRA